MNVFRRIIDKQKRKRAPLPTPERYGTRLFDIFVSTAFATDLGSDFFKTAAFKCLAKAEATLRARGVAEPDISAWKEAVHDTFASRTQSFLAEVSAVERQVAKEAP